MLAGSTAGPGRARCGGRSRDSSGTRPTAAAGGRPGAGSAATAARTSRPGDRGRRPRPAAAAAPGEVGQQRHLQPGRRRHQGPARRQVGRRPAEPLGAAADQDRGQRDRERDELLAVPQQRRRPAPRPPASRGRLGPGTACRAAPAPADRRQAASVRASSRSRRTEERAPAAARATGSASASHAPAAWSGCRARPPRSTRRRGPSTVGSTPPGSSARAAKAATAASSERAAEACSRPGSHHGALSSSQPSSCRPVRRQCRVDAAAPAGYHDHQAQQAAGRRHRTRGRAAPGQVPADPGPHRADAPRAPARAARRTPSRRPQWPRTRRSATNGFHAATVAADQPGRRHRGRDQGGGPAAGRQHGTQQQQLLQQRRRYQGRQSGGHGVQRDCPRQLGAEPELAPGEARRRDEDHVVAEDEARGQRRAEGRRRQHADPGGDQPRAQPVDVPSSAAERGLGCAGPGRRPAYDRLGPAARNPADTMDDTPRDRDDLPQVVDAALPPPVTRGSAWPARGATWVAVAMAGANALGYLLNLVASRVLGPTAFGALGALLGLVLIGNVVALGLQTVTARVLASSPEDGGRSAGDLYRLGRWSAAAVTGLALAAAPVVAHLLHLRRRLVRLGPARGPRLAHDHRRPAGAAPGRRAVPPSGRPLPAGGRGEGRGRPRRGSPSGAPSPPRWPGPRPGRWSARRPGHLLVRDQLVVAAARPRHRPPVRAALGDARPGACCSC